MMRFATVDPDPTDRRGLRDALTRCAVEAHHSSVAVTAFPTVGKLASTLNNLRPHFYDIAIICLDGLRPTRDAKALRQTLVSQIGEMHVRHPELALVIASHDTSCALDAFGLGARFFLLSGGYESLRRVLAEPLTHVGWDEQPCLAVRSSSRVDNMPIEDIQFIESSKRGPVIHLPEGRTVTTRGTLRGIYEQLAAPGMTPTDGTMSFIMAGSSFIVNLDNVLASGKGALVFADGETIIVPVRKRKGVEDALEAYQTGRTKDLLAERDRLTS